MQFPREAAIHEAVRQRHQPGVAIRDRTRRVDLDETLMPAVENSGVVQLGKYLVEPGKSSVSGLSSGAFMTVQMHLAHSSSFCGAGIIAGGPFRCAESFRAAALLAEDAFEQGAV